MFKLVIEHTLAVLLDKDFSHDYKNEYKHILGGLMDAKVAHSISISTLHTILQYIRAVVVDAAAVRDERNQKILRNFSKAMMKDTANFSVYEEGSREICTRDLASSLLDHFNYLFEQLVDDSGLQMDLASMFAESGLHLVEHCGVNIIPLLFNHALEPLRIISCHLPKLSDFQRALPAISAQLLFTCHLMSLQHRRSPMQLRPSPALSRYYVIFTTVRRTLRWPTCIVL